MLFIISQNKPVIEAAKVEMYLGTGHYLLGEEGHYIWGEGHYFLSSTLGRAIFKKLH